MSKKKVEAPDKVVDRRGEFLLALQSSLGNVAETCVSTNTSREEFEQWLESDRWFARMVSEVEQTHLDKAEEKLQQLIRMGDLGAIKYYLDRKGRGRGYGETSTLNLRGSISEDACHAVTDWLESRGAR
jgi:hypothetical protein